MHISLITAEIYGCAAAAAAAADAAVRVLQLDLVVVAFSNRISVTEKQVSHSTAQHVA